MDKIPTKFTKDTKRQEAVRKGKEKYINKLRESILNDAEKVVKILAMQAMKLPMPPTVPQTLPPVPPPLSVVVPPLVPMLPQDHVIPISTALVQLFFGHRIFFAYSKK